MNRIRSFLFGAGVLASLGFGVVSASAKPAMERRIICPYTQIYEECSDCCGIRGVSEFHQATGYCRCVL
jgi:hypothetical protein